MDKPTQKQIKKFWEGYGLYKKNGKVEWWAELPFPPIDLNNLFKYAVPKLDGAWAVRLVHYVDSVNWHAELTYGTLKYGEIKVADRDPALALFWALWQVKEDKGL